MMRNALAIAVCVLLSLGCGTNLAAQVTSHNWKQLGYSKVGAVDAAWFYDTSNIRHPSAGTVRTWIKGLRVKDVEKEIEARPSVAARIGDLRGKLAATQGIWDQMTTEEEVQREIEWVVNTASIEPLMVVLYELDCKKAMIRGLSIHAKVDGKVRSENRAEEWRHIGPESVESTLAQILCVA